MTICRELSSMQILPLGICGVLVLTAALLIFVNSCVMQLQWKYRGISGMLALSALFLLQGLADTGISLECGFSFSFFAIVVGNLPWLGIVFLMTVISIAEVKFIIQIKQKRKNMLTPDAIKESLDALPDGICFFAEDGQPLLVNEQMQKLSGELVDTEILNGELFFDRLKRKTVGEDSEIIRTEPTVIARTGDEKVWDFHRNILKVGHQRLQELVAYDVTKQYGLRRELEERNEALSRVNERLRRYSREVEHITREKEILAAKMRVHDDVGRSLLAFRSYLAQSGKMRDRDKLLILWRHTISVMKNEAALPAQNNDWEMLLEAAESVDVALVRDGEFPEDKKNRAVLMAAIHECLTNTVKHADGNRLIIAVRQSDRNIMAELSNNGHSPAGEIRETGGLKNLRHMVESAGGDMKIESMPRFVLRVLLPKGDEEEWAEQE